jgi:Raf kinase inhibitor-like YbhB/YbcL family protein
MRRRTLLQTGGATLTLALAGCITRSSSTGDLTISSSALTDGGTFPPRFTCDGRGISPPLTVESAPDSTATLAVVARSTVGILDNPTLWTCWNIPADTTEIPAELPRTETLDALGGARQGTAGDREPGYRPLCPPPGQPYDHWVQAYALDTDLDTVAGLKNDDALEAIEGAQIASDRITASYTRAGTPTPSG